MLDRYFKADVLIRIFITAILYYLAGKLAMPLVGSVYYSGAIWPPVGIGLGAVLLWGNRILPSVFLGEIALKLAYFEVSALQMTSSTWGILIFMAMNGVLRTWLGVYLVRRFANFPNPLFELKDILLFFLYSCLIATFVSTVFNIFAIYTLDLVQKQGVLLTGINWWLGDGVGGVIFTPLFLLIFARHDDNWQRRRISVGIPLTVLFIISVIIFQVIRKQEERRLHDVFNALTEQFQTTFELNHFVHLEQLKFVKHFFETDEKVSKDEFSQFTQALFTSAFLQSLQWITYSGNKNKNNFSVKYKLNSADTKLQPGLDRLDQKLLRRFVDSHSETVYLINKDALAENTLILAFTPVYKAQRLIGVINANIALGAMINHHIKTVSKDGVLIQIRENNSTGPLLFQSEQAQASNNLVKKLDYYFLVNPGLHFLLLPTNNFIQKNYSIIVWWVSAAMMLVMSTLTIVLLMLSGYTEVIKKEVKERTEALRVSNIKLAESESQFKELVQAQLAIVWRYDPGKKLFSFVSDEAEKLLGYPKSRWLTEVGFWDSCIDERDREWAVNFCLSNTAQQQEHDFDYRMVKADGSVIWIRDIVNFKYKDGEIIELLGFMIDITQQKQTEEQLRLAATSFDGLDGIMITDADAKIVRVNHAFEEITGYSAEQAIGKKPDLLSSGTNSAAFYQDLWNTLISTGRYEGEILNRRLNGDIFPVWQRITAVTDEQNRVSHYVSVFTDITEQKETELKIHNIAFYDSLTSLPNRRYLIERLEKETAIAKRHGKSGALLFLDLDHFKILNDSLGHHIGDELLVQVAERIQAVIRSEDSAIRLGGDEFVIILNANANNLKQAAEHGLLVAEKIKDALNGKFILQSYQHYISPSIGVTLYPEENQTINMILQQADTAMYRSKDLGRNRISFFHPRMQVAADVKLKVEKELRIAIEQEQFVLFYQPQVDTQGQLISAEALVRWLHPEKGVISPADFISIAEETGLILPLGTWIVTEVCRQIKVWQQQGLIVKNIAINVSSKQFRQQDFVKTVQQSIEESGISPRLLEIELTEGVLIDDIKDTVQKMQALKDLGVSIAIDDFGTGYSSLAYLKQLPLDVLKIDQSFVRDIMMDQSDAVIVETIIDMSHNLGLHTIAEGVETEDQYDFLSDKGCKMFQGYYFSKPLKAEDFSKNFIV